MNEEKNEMHTYLVEGRDLVKAKDSCEAVKIVCKQALSVKLSRCAPKYPCIEAWEYRVKDHKGFTDVTVERVYPGGPERPGRFLLRSGKEFTYEPRIGYAEIMLIVHRVYREGEERDFGYLKIGAGGTVKGFAFHSFSGINETELNEARIYLQDCTELLSSEFVEKVVADYKEKFGKFKLFDGHIGALTE
jgi:hypothetical protein